MKIKCNLRIAGLVGSLMLSIGSYAQTNGIYPLTDASKSRGFSVWQPIEGATYRVEIYQKDEGYQLIGSDQTANSYYHFDPLIFTVPGIGYKIIALSAQNPSIVLSESDIIEYNGIVGDPMDYHTICKATCDGRTYAWSMEAYGEINWLQQWDEMGNQAYTLGNIRLQLDGAAQYYNSQTGDYTPYWQPISQNNWDNISSTHPYKQILSPYTDLYMKLPVSPNLSDGPFFDASNNPVIDGKLVEKKLDQFNYMKHASTIESASATSYICSAPLTGFGLSWSNFFNQHMGELYNPVPTSVQPFALTVPDGVECLEAYSSPDPWDDGEDWNDWVENLYDAAREIEEELIDLTNGGGLSDGDLNWGTVLQEFEQLCTIESTAGATINSVLIQSVIHPETYAIMQMDENSRLILKENSGDLTTGVHSIGLYTSDGNVLSSIMEFTHELPQAKLNEYNQLVIFPNPIEDRVLKLSVRSSKDSEAQLFVHNLFGDQVYSEYISLTDANEFIREIDVQNVQSPLYQLKVTLVFSDGSVLQNTALTVD